MHTDPEHETKIVLGAHLRALREELLAREPQVRLGVRDSVHQMRVTTRRLRGALASFGPLLTGDDVAHLRGELRWLGGVLGAARDAEVMRAHLADLLAALPGELVDGAVRTRVDDAGRRAERAARGRALKTLGSGRYRLLLEALEALVDAPPWGPDAAGPADAVLGPVVGRDARRVKDAWRAAWASPAGPARDALLHETRKAAKRVRYAAEAAGPAMGDQVARLASAAAGLQTILGDHHDSVQARATLRRLCAQAESAGESGFGYGLLYALERARADEIEARVPAAWDRFRRRRRRLRRRLRRG